MAIRDFAVTMPDRALRSTAPWWKTDLGLLPLYALVLAAAVAFTGHWAPALGAWPLLTVLACPLLHLTLPRL